jgi:hypothetical protein
VTASTAQLQQPRTRLVIGYRVVLDHIVVEMAQRVQQEAQQAVQPEIQPEELCLGLIHPHRHSLLETTRVEMMKGQLQGSI